MGRRAGWEAGEDLPGPGGGLCKGLQDRCLPRGLSVPTRRELWSCVRRGWSGGRRWGWRRGTSGTRGQREGPARGVGGLLVPPRLNSRRTMAQCRDLENHHHEKLLEAAINTLEKTVKGELDEDLPDDVRAVSAGARGGRRHSAVRSTAGVSGPAPQGGALRPRVSCAEVQQQVCHALGRAPLSFLRH